MPYLLPDDQTLVAKNLEALLTVGPVHPIDQNEYGEVIAAQNYDCGGQPTVWTGLLNNGLPISANCFAWTDDTNALFGNVGYLNDTAAWSSACNAACGSDRRLYCFEQGP